MSSTCSPQALNTFLNVSDPANLNVNATNAANTYPFISSFADGSLFSFTENTVTTDATNTLTYQGTMYSLLDIQLCTATVNMTTGITSKSGRGITTESEPAAELLLTFTSPTAKNNPTALVMVVPVYEGNASDNARFLSELLNNGTTVQPLSSLFNNTSYGYNVCITTSGKLSIPTYILNFWSGCTLLSKDITLLKNLTDYTFNPANGQPIVTSFQPDSNGVLQAAATNDTTFLCKSVKTTSVEYQNNVIVYLKVPITSTQTQPSAVFQLNQYKCFPFSELHNMTSDTSGIVMADAVSAMKDADPTIKFTTVGIVILSILGVITGLGLCFVLFKYFSTLPDMPPDMLATGPAPAPVI